MASIKSVSRWVATFVSPHAVISDGHGEKVRIESLDGDNKVFRAVFATDGVTTFDPRTLVFVTGHSIDSKVTSAAVRGDKRAARQRRLVTESAYVPQRGRMTLAEVAMHYATVGKDEPGYGYSGTAERIKVARRIARQKVWDVTEL